MEEEPIEEISEHDRFCDDALKLITKNGCSLDYLVEKISNKIIPCIGELLAGDLIEKANATMYYTKPAGYDVCNNYDSYSQYKKAHLIEFKTLSFKNDIIELLKENPYANVDILSLVKKYTFGKGFVEAQKLREEIRDILFQLERAKEIDEIRRNDNNLIDNLTTVSYGNFYFRQMNIRSTTNFEEKYMKEPIIPSSSIHVSIRGDAKGVVIGHHTEIKTFAPSITDNKTQDLPEQKWYNKKMLGLTKRQIAWTIIGIVVAIGIAILSTLFLLYKAK